MDESLSKLAKARADTYAAWDREYANHGTSNYERHLSRLAYAAYNTHLTAFKETTA